MQPFCDILGRANNELNIIIKFLFIIVLFTLQIFIKNIEIENILESNVLGTRNGDTNSKHFATTLKNQEGLKCVFFKMLLV